MTVRCEPSCPADIAALKTLWKQSFDDTDQAIELFFTRFFRPSDCAVCREEGQVVAAAHMLPVAMAHEDGPLPGHYIYAAATLPAFRGRGRMGALLGYAADYGRRRGDVFSLLVPARPSLFPYYQTQGYQSFSSIEIVTLTREECVRRAQGRISPVPEQESLDFYAMYSLRNRVLRGRRGSLLWDRAALERAAALSAVYGGRVIQPDNDCYAFVRRRSEHTLEVTECMAVNGKGFDKLMLEMVKLSFKTCILRLPVAPTSPGLRGARSAFALCKPLGDLPGGLDFSFYGASYVGLPLD